MSEHNGWTKKKVEELTSQVSEIHTKVHKMDKTLAVAVAELTTLRNDHDELNREVRGNTLAIAKTVGAGAGGGGLVSIAIFFFMRAVGM